MKHPNALIGSAAAGVGGQIVLEITSWFGWTITAGLAIWIAAAITGAALFVGRRGLVGVWRAIKYGQHDPDNGNRPAGRAPKVAATVTGTAPRKRR